MRWRGTPFAGRPAQRVQYPAEKAAFYKLLKEQAALYTGEESEQTAVLANAASVLAQAFPEANWVGFYLIEGSRRGTMSSSPARSASVKCPGRTLSMSRTPHIRPSARRRGMTISEWVLQSQAMCPAKQETSTPGSR